MYGSPPTNQASSGLFYLSFSKALEAYTNHGFKGICCVVPLYFSEDKNKIISFPQGKRRRGKAIIIEADQVFLIIPPTYYLLKTFTNLGKPLV